MRQTTTRNAKDKREMIIRGIQQLGNINTAAVAMAAALHLNLFALLFALLKIQSIAWTIGIPAGLLDLYLLSWAWWQLWRRRKNSPSDMLTALLHSLISERSRRA